MKREKRLRPENIIIAVLLLTGTLTRLIIGLKLPLLIQGDSKYDDFMLVEYAENILAGKWLGDFTYKTLIKTASFPLLLDLSYVLGISYALLMNLMFIAAVAVLALVMKKLIGNKIWAALFYLFMLFSPVMLHEENVQKVYRGGYIVIFAIFIIASVTGLFAYYDDKTGKLIALAILLTAALPIFWYLKEDSVWIMPFVAGGLFFTVLRSILAKKDRKVLLRNILCCTLPMLLLLLAMTAYRANNKRVYGIYTDTDRGGTYFREVIEDLMTVENASDGPAWVTQEAFHRVMAESKTFRQMAYEIDMSYELRLEEDNEVHGDFIIAGLREAASVYGIYTSAKDANNYWKQVHEELTEAYKDGRLKKNEDAIFLSGIARGFSREELAEYYGGRLGEVIRTIITYDHNCVTLKESTGTEEQIDRMNRIVRGRYISADTSDAEMKSFERSVNLANGITGIYSRTGRIVALLAALGFVLLFIRFVSGIRKGSHTQDGWILLLSFGMALTAGLVVFAVMWFCNFLTIWKIYDYSCGAVIFMEIAEAIGIYYFILIAVDFLRKKIGHK